MARDILMIAGEASADLHAAHLLREIKLLIPGTHFFGVGGRHLSEEGMEITVPAERLNVVGVADWTDRLWDVLRAYRTVKREVAKRRPCVAILLDLPDFNLRLAKYLRRLHVPVVYYISPQVWAWRRYRIRTIRRVVDRMLVVFPFEKTFYDQYGIDAHFVGHPLLEQLSPRNGCRPQADIYRSPRVALLPGSRPSELRFHAELLRGIAQKLKARYPGARIKVPIASTLRISEVREALQDAPVECVEGDSRAVLEWADVAAVASGTASLEAGVIGTPFCLFYRMSRSSFWIVRHLFRYHGAFGMPNLLHRTEVVREFIQDKATVDAVFQECRRLIDEEDYRSKQVAQLGRCWTQLGQMGASQRAANEVVQVLRSLPSHEAHLVSSPA